LMKSNRARWSIEESEKEISVLLNFSVIECFYFSIYKKNDCLGFVKYDV
jgi:hypothetical protein